VGDRSRGHGFERDAVEEFFVTDGGGMKNQILTGVLLLMLFGCRKQPTEPRPLDPFERWRSYNLGDYTIDQVRSCFCPNGGQAMRLTVRFNGLAKVTNLSDNTRLTESESVHYLTVDSLFGIIHYSRTDSLVVTYNPTYGYPESLDVNPQLHPVDGGVLYLTSNLRFP
jgi:hypothetical protein